MSDLHRKIEFMQQDVMQDVHAVVSRLDAVRLAIDSAAATVEATAARVAAATAEVGAAANKIKADFPVILQRTANLEEYAQRTTRVEREAIRNASTRLESKTQEFLKSIDTERATLDGIRLAVAAAQEAAQNAQTATEKMNERFDYHRDALKPDGSIFRQLHNLTELIEEDSRQRRAFERRVSVQTQVAAVMSSVTLVAALGLALIVHFAGPKAEVASIPATAFDAPANAAGAAPAKEQVLHRSKGMHADGKDRP
jgi:hypothetical protein